MYYNNPNGITRKMTIADFESLMSGEGGSGSSGSSCDNCGPMVVLYDGTSLDKTFKEITDALSSGKFVYVYHHVESEGEITNTVWFVSDASKFTGYDYSVTCIGNNNPLMFTSETEDGVLELEESSE